MITPIYITTIQATNKSIWIFKNNHKITDKNIYGIRVYENNKQSIDKSKLFLNKDKALSYVKTIMNEPTYG